MMVNNALTYGQEMYLLGLQYARRMIELDKELGKDDALEYIEKNIKATEEIIEGRKEK